MTPALQDAAPDAPDLSALAPLLEFFLDGGTLGEALGCTSEEYEATYAIGHSLYGQGRYEEASQLFRLLAFYEPDQARFQMALGSSLQMLELHQEAMTHHALACALEPEDPTPALRIGECLIALGHLAQAVEALDMVLGQCEPGRHDALAQRAQALRALIARNPQHAQGVSS